MPRAQLWKHLADTRSFQQWWPWLRSIDPVELEPGATTRCLIGPPLPYVLGVDLTVVEVVPEELVRVDVDGDLRGPARLEVSDLGDASSARLAWEVDVQRPLLHAASRVARPLLEWGHDWVVNTGVEQFRRRALNGR